MSSQLHEMSQSKVRSRMMIALATHPRKCAMMKRSQQLHSTCGTKRQSSAYDRSCCGTPLVASSNTLLRVARASEGVCATRNTRKQQ